MRTVVVGNGMAGARVAAELRARADAKVTVLGAEPHPAYNRILLSNLLAGGVAESDVELAESAGHGLDLRRGTTVTAIDRAGRAVTTDRAGVIEYDRLVLAVGSTAFLPPLPGLRPADGGLPDRVAVFRTLDDCRRILAAATPGASALVLGGGPLGLEAARGLATRGVRVRVVHPVGHLMERQLDPAASAVLVRTLARLGVATELGATACAVRAHTDGVGVELADGRALRADLLVVSCGVTPRTELARAAGLRVGRGIVVDDELRTSDPRIFAIGDCAEHRGEVSGLVAPAWEQARVAAEVIAGGSAYYRPIPTVTRLKAPGIDLAAMGRLSPGGDGVEELSFSDPARGTYARLLVEDDRLTGAIMLGDNPTVGAVIQLFDRGTPVPRDRRRLLLGRPLDAAPVVATPALMPDAATVCHCNGVTKRALVASWRSGARSCAEVVAATRATTGCGGCVDAVTGIVDWLSTVDPVETVEVVA